jgi:alanine racemase
LTAASQNSAISATAAAAKALSEPPRRLARLTVSTDAIAGNWRIFANLGAAEAGAVIKADGYGLGAAAAARALAEAGARTFFVATLGEALEARAALGGGPRLLVLNGLGEGQARAFADAALEPVINTHEQLRLWPEGPFALHIDTGMNRLGLPMSELWAIDRPPALVMSHLACASDRLHPLNEIQRSRFLDSCERFPGVPRSLSASAGALLGPDFAFDLLRPGIGLYGGGPLDAGNPALAVAATLTAPILQIREVLAGDSVGYGATFVASRTLRAATCALGYADGFLRSSSGKGYGWLRGRRCPILGRVSMDLVTLDVSAVPAPHVGEEVEFLGGFARLDDVAAAAGTLGYEILTNLGGRVARVIAR